MSNQDVSNHVVLKRVVHLHQDGQPGSNTTSCNGELTPEGRVIRGESL